MCIRDSSPTRLTVPAVAPACAPGLLERNDASHPQTIQLVAMPSSKREDASPYGVTDAGLTTIAEEAGDADPSSSVIDSAAAVQSAADSAASPFLKPATSAAAVAQSEQVTANPSSESLPQMPGSIKSQPVHLLQNQLDFADEQVRTTDCLYVRIKFMFVCVCHSCSNILRISLQLHRRWWAIDLIRKPPQM